MNDASGPPAGMAQAPTGGALIGRARECAALDAQLRDLRAGVASAVVLRGEPGIGKTALLDWATTRASGIRVLRADCTHRLAAEAYGLLKSLLPDDADRLPELEPGDRSCLASLLRPSERRSVGPDRAGAALVACLSIVADAGPLLLAVDDVQWADTSSMEAIATTVERLSDDPIAFLFTERWDHGGPLGGKGLEVLELHGLDEPATVALLATHVEPAVSQQLWAATGGNPLALLEISATLDEDERAGREPIADRLASAALSIDSSFLSRVGQLPPEARRLLEVVSVGGALEVSRLLLIGRSLGFGERELGTLVGQGFTRLGEGSSTAMFTHPLLRAAVYRSLAPASLRRLHLRIAETLRREHDLPRRAWHLAAAADGPAEPAAGELEEAGRLAAAAGAVAVAADAFERSAALSPAPESRAARLLEAGRAAWLSGAIDRGRSLLDMALGLTEDPLLRADVQLARAVFPPHPRHFHEVYEELEVESEAVQARDPRRAALLLAMAVFSALSAGDLDVALSTAERALRLVEGDQAVEPTLRTLRAMALSLRGDLNEAMVDFVDFAERFASSGPTPQMARMAEYVALGLCAGEHFTTATMILDRLAEYEQAHGAIGMLALTLGVRAEVRWRCGRWLPAFADAGLAAEHARRSNYPVAVGAFAFLSLARVQASLGRHDDARASGEEAVELIGGEGGYLAYHCSATLGFCALAAGDLETALRHLTETRQTARRHGIGNPAVVLWHADLVEVAEAVGELALARTVAREFESAAQGIRAPGLRTAVARALGIADEGTGRRYFEPALGGDTTDLPPFGLARTELAFAAKLARAGEPDAIRYAESALRRFEQLGALPWSKRALLQLAGRPWQAPQEISFHVRALSSRELEIAIAAAQGRTSRAVASELFLSPRTVEYHLAAVYRKLSVHNRIQLANVLRNAGAIPS